MTRSDLVEELANRFKQLTQRDAEQAVKTILDALSNALSRGHRVEIRGFGSFSVNRRPPRLGRNPRSGCRASDQKVDGERADAVARRASEHWQRKAIRLVPNTSSRKLLPVNSRD